MRFLLFLLGITYFFIFFFLYKKGIESSFISIFWQAQIYLLLTLIMISATFSTTSKKDDTESSHIISSILHSGKESYHHITQNFFQVYLYPIGIILFYTSLYLIGNGLYADIEIQYIFAFVNVFAIITYFLTKKSQLLYDIIRGNTFIISVFYILFHVLLLFGGNVYLEIIDYFNLFCISILFILLFISEKSVKRSHILASHALCFFLGELAIFLFHGLEYRWFLSVYICIIALIVHIFYMHVDYLSRISYIGKNFFLLAGLFLSFFLVPLFALVLFQDFFLFHSVLYIIACVMIAYMFLYYVRFGNILSCLAGSILILITSVSLWYHFSDIQTFFSYAYVVFLGLSCFSFFLIFCKKYFKKTDLYIIHIFFISVNLFGVLLFFIFTQANILTFGYLLFFEAIYYLLQSYISKNIYIGKLL